MNKPLVMTIHDREPEALAAVFAGISLPGNRPDELVVCFDRAPERTVYEVMTRAERMNIPVRHVMLDDEVVGPRCPSRAWNAALDLVSDDFAFCISSDVILGPHSIGLAYYIAEKCTNAIICGKADHCGQSYYWAATMSDGENHEMRMVTRSMTSAMIPRPLGFNWLLPMKYVRKIGGYDEAFMQGVCYEDDDFVIRMWRAGVDVVFTDDVFGIHLEHRRDHVLDKDGRVSKNAQLFVERYGNIDYLKDLHFKHISSYATTMPGFRMWTHEKDNARVKSLARWIQFYCVDAPWRAVIPKDPPGSEE